ncbi:MAG: radical SAM protein [Deltaproteobacteria bacterium]|nr:radical SAM protein [Deltaproteobacteria bacterium]
MSTVADTTSGVATAGTPLPEPATRVRHARLRALRLHLRLGDPSLLWVNGSRLFHLNAASTAVWAALIEVLNLPWDHIDEGRLQQAMTERLAERQPDAAAQAVLAGFRPVLSGLLETAVRGSTLRPMDFATADFAPRRWTAPAKAIVALTHRCNNDCYFCYADGSRRTVELTTAEWKQALDRLWDHGVPQLVFSGGEPTLVRELVELVRHARRFHTGLITNGRRLAALAPALRDAGLDYVQVSLESHDADVHDRMVGARGAWRQACAGLREAVGRGLRVSTNATLTADNLAELPELISFARSLGVTSMSCNGLVKTGRGRGAASDNGLSGADLNRFLAKALATAKEVGVRLHWLSSPCHKDFDPTLLGLRATQCSAAQYELNIEPDGSVTPCQSWLKDVVGNILADPWEAIWNHPVCVGFRERRFALDRPECASCALLQGCGGGCPLSYD